MLFRSVAEANRCFLGEYLLPGHPRLAPSAHLEVIESLVGALTDVVGRFRWFAILPSAGTALFLLTKSIGRSSRSVTLVQMVKFFVGRVIHNTTFSISISVE